MTFGIAKLTIITFSIMTFSIMTFGLTTFGIMTFAINDIWHHFKSQIDTQHNVVD
jgi:hypothetical protein